MGSDETCASLGPIGEGVDLFFGFSSVDPADVEQEASVSAAREARSVRP